MVTSPTDATTGLRGGPEAAISRHKTGATGPRRPTKYLPGLDGLRAIAVISVVLYHGGVGWLPGGFLGVDVFFVISGFLITRLLLSEVAADDRIDVVRFWKRRARRLLPALWTLLVSVAVWLLVAHSNEVGRIRGDLAGAMTYVTNWFLVVTGRSYFDQFGRPSPLRHLWSLAVEEQFYLVWPVLFGCLLRWRLGRRSTFAVIVGGAIASTALMAVLFHPGHDPSRVYYGTDTRAGGLLIGAAYAVWARRRTGSPKPTAGWRPDALFAGGLVGFAAMAMSTGDQDVWLYRGGFLVVSLVALAMVAAVVHPGARLSVRAMSTPLLRWIGLRSYAIYLWHWPVVVFTRPGVDLRLTGWPVLALRLAITAVLAELSWRLVEDPIRRGLAKRWWEARHQRRWAFAAVWTAAGASVFGLTTAVMAHTSKVDEITASIQAGQAALASIQPDTTSAIAAAPLRTALTNDSSTTKPAAPANTSISPQAITDAPTIEAPTIDALTIDAPTTETTTTDAPPPDTTPVTTTTIAPVPRRTIQYAIPSTAIGDSVMLGSAPALMKTFGRAMVVDAKVSRQFKVGVELLEKRQQEGTLGDVVIVHLGDNGAFTAPLLDRLLRAVADVPAVVLVAPKVPFTFETPLRDMLYRRTQPLANVRIADWTTLASAHPEFLFTDNVHLREPGSRAYASMLAETVLRMCGPPDAGDATKPPLLLDRCVARLPPEAVLIGSTSTIPVQSDRP